MVDHIHEGRILEELEASNAERIPTHNRIGHLWNALYRIKDLNASPLIAEFGVYKGASLAVISEYFWWTEVHAFDSFEGLPEAYRINKPGVFRLSEEQQRTLTFPGNVKLHKGRFADTIPSFAAANAWRAAAFLHIDCDVYSSTRDVLFNMHPTIVPGTFLLFDEYFNFEEEEDLEYKAFKEYCETYDRTFEYISYHIPGNLTRGLPSAGQVLVKMTR